VTSKNMSDIINLKEYREKGEKEAESKNKEDSNNPEENKNFTTKVKQKILDSGYRSIPDLDTIDIEFDFKENSLEISGAFFFKRDNQRKRLKSRLTDQLDFVDSVTFRDKFESGNEDFSEKVAIFLDEFSDHIPVELPDYILDGEIKTSRSSKNDKLTVEIYFPQEIEEFLDQQKDLEFNIKEAVNMYFQTEIGEVKLKNTRMEVDNS
jgi:hypothetical protein